MRKNLVILFGFSFLVSIAQAESADLHLERSLHQALRHATTVDRDDPRHPFFQDTLTALVSVNRWAGVTDRVERTQALIDRIFTDALTDLGALDPPVRARIARFLETLAAEVNGPAFTRRAFALANARKLRERRDLLCEACLHAGAFSLTVDLAVGLSALACNCLTPKLALSLAIGNAVIAYLTWRAQAEEREALRLDDAPNLVGLVLRSCDGYLNAQESSPPAMIGQP